MTLKRFCIFFSIVFLLNASSLNAEEFIAQKVTFEKKGKQVEIGNLDLSGLPIFFVDYDPKTETIKIKCSAGTLILKKGLFCYGYCGVHKGMDIAIRAYLKNGNIEYIVYEEWDKIEGVKVITHYYKK